MYVGMYSHLEAQNKELQAQLEAQRLANEQYQSANEQYKENLLRENAEREARMEARMAELERRLMRDANCDPMFKTRPYDPRDSSGDGGSGAGATFPVG